MSTRMEYAKWINEYCGGIKYLYERDYKELSNNASAWFSELLDDEKAITSFNQVRDLLLSSLGFNVIKDDK